MCRHIQNAQVSIRAPCCQEWYDCAECHNEAVRGDHDLKKSTAMCFQCKLCLHIFEKDLHSYEESDEYCPSCDNHYLLDAETPQEDISVVDSVPSSYYFVDANTNKTYDIRKFSKGDYFDPRINNNHPQ